MTKLYYVSGVCSLASHIALREAGGDFRLDKMNRETRITESGENDLQLNPKGSVPALQLDITRC
jgi:glutathione S-transferase